MTAAVGHGRTNRKERVLAAVGMPARHPELLTRKRGRAKRKKQTL